MIFRLIATLMLLCGIAWAGEPSSVKKLEKTRVFAFGGIGYAGTTSEGETAFHSIFASETAEGDFLRLLKAGNPQAKCYALVGLRLKSRAAFTEHVKPFITSKSEVRTCSGCMMSTLPMSSVVPSIQRGNYDKQATAKPGRR